MAERQPFSGSIDIEGKSYPFSGAYSKMELEPRGARFGWNAVIEGLDLPPADRVIAIPQGYPGINPRMVTVFVQDYFQGLVRLRALDPRGRSVS